MKDLYKLYTDEWHRKLNTDIGYQKRDLDSDSWGAFKSKASSSFTNIFEARAICGMTCCYPAQS